MSEQPELPYGRGEDANSGYSGTDTSEERARRQDADGTTRQRQQATLGGLAARRAYGLTWKELADSLGVHHGAASGVLSTLHKAGRIARLSERRHGCKVYVLPEYTNGRRTEEQGRNRPVDERESITYEVRCMVGVGDWVTIESTVPLTTPEEARSFVEANREQRPMMWQSRPWKVVEVVRRTYHTLTY
jgi:hypothetical protein